MKYLFIVVLMLLSLGAYAGEKRSTVSLNCTATSLVFSAKNVGGNTVYTGTSLGGLRCDKDIIDLKTDKIKNNLIHTKLYGKIKFKIQGGLMSQTISFQLTKKQKTMMKQYISK